MMASVFLGLAEGRKRVGEVVKVRKEGRGARRVSWRGRGRREGREGRGIWVGSWR